MKRKIPVEKNKIYETEITALLHDGNGMGSIDGFAVFIPGGIPGDVVCARIVHIRDSFAYGEIISIIRESEHRVKPVCEAYEECGGCQLMHMSYEKQHEEKLRLINDSFERIGKLGDFRAEKINGLENPIRYRNKMVFPFGKDKNGETVCGFYRRKSHDVIPLNDCLLGDETVSRIMRAAVSYARKNNVSVYDEASHTGFLRRLFIRTANKTKEIMVVLSVNGKKLPKSEEFVSEILAASENVKSIVLNINTAKTNLVLGDKNKTLYGSGRITDELLGVKFFISPHSFFQVNPVLTEMLYSKALEYAGLTGNENVIDIYCGIGTISLCAARNAKRVIGVEIVEQAIADARENAERNGISNAEFYAGSAQSIVPDLVKKIDAPDVVILDPPRKGCDKKTLSAIAAVLPKRIVYVSCNPATLARDAAFLTENGYKPEKAEGFDMFPHTMHVETVVLLSHKKPDSSVT